jgi:hypothetical protein
MFTFKMTKSRFYTIAILILTLGIIFPFAFFTLASNIQEQNLDQFGTRATTRASTYTDHDIYTIHGGSLAGGMVSGDLDSDDSDEIILVGGSSEGRVVMLDYNKTSGDFDPEILWWDPNGALMDLAVADVDTSTQGSEIIVGGFSGNLSILSYSSPKNVQNKTIWNTTFQSNTSEFTNIFGLAAGDFEPATAGLEIAVADAATNYLYVLSNKNNKWDDERIPLDDIPRNVYVGDFDGSYSGAELLVICVNGSVYRIARDDNDWDSHLIFKDSRAPMSAVIDDFNSTHPGLEVIISGLSRNATLLWGSGQAWNNYQIWAAPGALEGMAYGEFDALHPGKELIIAGYSNTAVMLYEPKTNEPSFGWYTETIFYDPNPLQTELNGAVVSDFYPEHDGTELALIGFTGNVTMLMFEPPGFKLSTTSSDKTVTVGEFTTFQISMVTTSGYNKSVKLTVSGMPDDVDYSFSRTTLIPSGTSGPDTSSAVLTIDTFDETESEEYTITVTGKGVDDNLENSIDLKLTINPGLDQPDFEIVLKNESLYIIELPEKNYRVEIKVGIAPINNFDGNVELFVPEEVLTSPEFIDNIQVTIEPKNISIDDTATVEIFVSDPDKITETLNLTLPLHGIHQPSSLERSKNIPFRIEFEKVPPDGNGKENGDDEIPFNQMLSMILLIVVILIMLVFVITRIRIQAAREQKYLEQKRQEREEKRKQFGGGGGRGRIRSGPGRK